MANKKLPGGRKSAGRMITSVEKTVALQSGLPGVTISELPKVAMLQANARFPVVQEGVTLSASVSQLPGGVGSEGQFMVMELFTGEYEKFSDDFAQDNAFINGDGFKTWKLTVDLFNPATDTSFDISLPVILLDEDKKTIPFVINKTPFTRGGSVSFILTVYGNISSAIANDGSDFTEMVQEMGIPILLTYNSYGLDKSVMSELPQNVKLLSMSGKRGF